MSNEDISIITDEVYRIRALIAAMIRCFDPKDLGSMFCLCKIASEFADNLVVFLGERV